MITKIYNTQYNEACYPFKLGKFMFQATFTGGSIINGVRSRYITANAIEQLAIENSKLFKTGVIQLEQSTSSEEIKKEEKEITKVSSSASEKTIIEDVIDINGAVDYLKKIGVPHQSLRTSQLIQKAIDANNLSFPNLTIVE